MRFSSNILFECYDLQVMILKLSPYFTNAYIRTSICARQSFFFFLDSFNLHVNYENEGIKRIIATAPMTTTMSNETKRTKCKKNNNNKQNRNGRNHKVPKVKNKIAVCKVRERERTDTLHARKERLKIELCIAIVQHTIFGCLTNLKHI